MIDLNCQNSRGSLINFKISIMKKILLCAVLLVGYVGFSQETIQATYEEITNAKERPTYAGDITQYMAKDGSVYKVGDKITIGVPSSNKTFAFLSSGDGLMTPLVPLSIGVSGQKAEIMKFRISGTRRAGFTIWLKAKSAYGIGNYNVDFENAILNGEFTLKEFMQDQNKKIYLKPANKQYLPIELKMEDDFEIWGIVTNVIHSCL